MEIGSIYTAQPNHYASPESHIDQLNRKIELFIGMIEPTDLIGDAAARQDFKHTYATLHDEISQCDSDFHKDVLAGRLAGEVAKKFDQVVNDVVVSQEKINNDFLSAINDPPVETSVLVPFMDKWHQKTFETQKKALSEPSLQSEADRVSLVAFHYAANDEKAQQYHVESLEKEVKGVNTKSDTFVAANKVSMRVYDQQLKDPKAVSTQVIKIARHTLAAATVVSALVAANATAARAETGKETTEVVPDKPSANKEIKSNDTKITIPATSNKVSTEKPTPETKESIDTKKVEATPNFVPAPKDNAKSTAVTPPMPDKAPTVDKAPTKVESTIDKKDDEKTHDVIAPVVELPDVQKKSADKKTDLIETDPSKKTDSTGHSEDLETAPKNQPAESTIDPDKNENNHTGVPEVSLPAVDDAKDHDTKPVSDKDHPSKTEPSITPVIDLPEIKKDKDDKDKESIEDTPPAIGGVAVVTLPDPVKIEKSDDKDKSDHKDKPDELDFIVPPSAHVRPEPKIIEIPTHKQDTPKQEQGPSTPQQDFSHASDKMAGRGGVWERRGIAMKFFIDEVGLTPSQAAGFVANLLAETGADLNPGRNQSGGPAFGIAQWEGGRLMDLGAFAGTNQGDFMTQLQFIKYELNGKEKRAFDAIKMTTNREEAAKVVQNMYERPGTPHEDKRVAYAHEVGDAFNAEYQAILASRVPKQETNTNGILAGWPTTGEDAMKLFNQCDPRWGEIRTPNGVRACDVSCGPTSVAMAVNALTGKDLNPGDVIRMTNDKRLWLPGDQGTSFDAVINLGKNFGINGAQMQNFKDINAYREILKNGGMILVAGSGPAPFVPPSVGAHFVLIRGITEDGKFLVADPYPKTPDTNTGAWDAQPIINGTFGAVVFTK